MDVALSQCVTLLDLGLTDHSPIAPEPAAEADSHVGFVSQVTCSGLASSRTGGGSVKSTKLLMLASVGALAGCSAAYKQPQPSCEVITEPICSRVAETHLNDGSQPVHYSSPRSDSRVVPFVVPIFRTDGVLATEVDCYANTDSRFYTIVRSDLAIPPSSQESIDFLKDRHMCAEKGSMQRRQSRQAAKKIDLG